MKKIIFIIVFVLLTNAIFAQYQMHIKKTDNSIIDVWVADITEITFTNNTPCTGMPTITYDNKTYHTVQIGTQCWLKENLDVGTKIASMNGGNPNNQSNNSIIEKFCYNDNDVNCATYGGLYQWNEAMQYVTSPGVQGICPTGWHIPTDAEFYTLSTTVSNDGSSLKVAGSNTSGFSALLAGGRANAGNFAELGLSVYFWTSTENSTNANYLKMPDGVNPNIYHYISDKADGFSIRCLKN